MMVYGGCIEPEGRELENDTLAHDCKKCGGRGYTRHWELLEGGSINSYSRTWCDDCDHEGGDTDYMPMTEADYAEIYAGLDEILEGQVANSKHPAQSFRQKLIQIAKRIWH